MAACAVVVNVRFGHALSLQGSLAYKHDLEEGFNRRRSASKKTGRLRRIAARMVDADVYSCHQFALNIILRRIAALVAEHHRPPPQSINMVH